MTATIDYQEWHKRLEHPNFNVLYDMLKSGFLVNKHTPSLDVIRIDCIPCKLGKSKILPFPTHQPNGTQPFDTIHNDVCRVAPIISHANCKYFVKFIDDYCTCSEYNL